MLIRFGGLGLANVLATTRPRAVVGAVRHDHRSKPFEIRVAPRLPHQVVKRNHMVEVRIQPAKRIRAVPRRRVLLELQEIIQPQRILRNSRNKTHPLRRLEIAHLSCQTGRTRIAEHPVNRRQHTVTARPHRRKPPIHLAQKHHPGFMQIPPRRQNQLAPVIFSPKPNVVWFTGDELLPSP